ncbi:helix-turn-helix transcriptional regulator [Mesorhizobium sp. SB112]|uniref:helix-turn-helix domain-containing protein n=1 Tax=Mesorhizobium sp. SB112 TaxID=3151853 RepID=UPI003263B6A1
MSITGNQIKAARALAGLNQWELAIAANLDINTIRNFEAWNEKIVRGRTDILEKIHKAFSDAGVDLLDNGQESSGGRGVRFKGTQS